MHVLKAGPRRLGVSAVVVAMVALLVGGCASSAQVPEAQVSAAIAASNTSVQQAEQAGAQNYAPLELRQAQQKLEEARQAVAEGETLKAQRLAEKAQVDAQLAEAKTRSAKAQEAVDELNETIRALREEIERGRNQ